MKSKILNLGFITILLLMSHYIGAQNISYRSLISDQAISRYTLPRLDNAALLAEEMKLRRKGRANHFAEGRDVHLDIHTDGTWEENNSEVKIWRSAIQSVGAESLNLGFTSFYLPETASFYLINVYDNTKLGPFTSADNDDHTQLWTPIIASDEIVLELHVHQDKIAEVELVLSKVNHAFEDFKSGADSGSGSCNLDVTCGSADGYEIVEANRDIIQSVGGFTLNGVAQCSGVLVNNTSNNCVPYFLTARHCEISENNSPSIVVYWNYENSTCRQPNSAESGGPGDGSLDFFNSGSVIRASFEPSDMMLIELDDPVDPATDPYYAGWNRRMELSPSGVCIHHPNVEEKRISFDFDSLGYEITDDDEIAALIVNDWDIGTTEGGSSGAPLFNDRKQLIGQLRGGQASCGNNLFDFYGAFFRSWEGANTPETALKFWLDPNETNQEEIDGKFCSFVVSASETGLEYCNSLTSTHSFDVQVNENFSNNVTLNIEGVDAINATIAQNPLPPGEETRITLSNLDQLSGGTYNILVKASEGQDVSTLNYTLVVVDEPPIDLEPVFPLTDAIDVNPQSTFTWMSQGDSFDMQVSTNEQFDTLIVDISRTSELEFDVINLEPSTSYFWRIRGANICGNGDWTDPIPFRTGDINCYRIFADDLPQGIGFETPVTLTSDIFVPYGGSLTKLTLIDISGQHTWVADLTMKITNPFGEERILVENNCDDEDDFFINFSDDAASETIPCPYNIGGTYRPENSMEDWIGIDPKGTWTFTLMDDISQDGGRWDSWGIQICVEFSEDFSITTFMDEFEVCTQEDLELDVFIGEGFDADYMILTETNLPEGSIIGLEELQLGDNTLQLIGLPNVPSGQYEIVITVSDSGREETKTLTINKETGPSPAELVFPADQEVAVSIMPTLTWFTGNSNLPQSFELARAIDFLDPIIKQEVIGDTLAIDTPLTELTTYYWRILTTSDCGVTYSDIFSFTTEKVTATFDLNGRQFDVYPNPVQNSFVIESEGRMKDVNYSIYSVQGQRIVFQTLEENVHKHVVNVNHLSDGIYLLKVELGEHTYVDKLIIQR